MSSSIAELLPSSVSLEALTPAEKRELLHLLTEKARRRDENKLAYYHPYAKQIEFHAAGKTYRERLLMAANQVGKTYSGGAEVAMHLTGRYPVDWPGRRFMRPPMTWVAGVTNESTRDNPQRILMGRPGMFGTGAIPKSCILDTSSARGTPDLLDTVWVRHEITGEMSMLMFKSYERGREKWQGETLDIVWFDEEPPPDIYSEGLTRTNATKGMVLVTFTPLLGMSEVVRRFILPGENDIGARDRHVTSMTIDDAEHYTKEERERIAASYAEHEREARTKGIPALGEGRIFPVTEESISEDPFEIPAHWPRICGMDFGWDHPTAAVWMAWDRDNDVIHVYDVYKKSREVVAVHSSAIKSRGSWIPVAWPQDGLQTDPKSGIALKEQYVEEGVAMLHEHAQFDLPKIPGQEAAASRTSVEAGVLEMLQRMRTGRWKVFKHLRLWFDEFLMYHRKDGKIVKLHDDAISGSRYGMMMLRYARVEERQRKARTGAKRSWRTV